MPRRQCPKCQSDSAYLKVDGYDLVLRCLCGFLKVVATRLHQIEVIDDDEDDQDLKLPKPNTRLWLSLIVLASLERATSVEVTKRLHDFGHPSLTVSDVSSYLTILRAKGLVDPVVKRRGMPGGSTWVVTDQAIILIGI